MHLLKVTQDNTTFDWMELLNIATNWWDFFFSIYTFHTEPDKMALTFSLRYGMLIVGFWTVCLFFIYFLNVPLTRWGSWKAVFCLASEPQETGRFIPIPRAAPAW